MPEKDCRVEFSSWEEIRESLRAAGKVTPPEDFLAGVMQRIETLDSEQLTETISILPEKKRRFGWLQGFPFASWKSSLVAAAVFVGLLVGSWNLAGDYFFKPGNNLIAENPRHAVGETPNEAQEPAEVTPPEQEKGSEADVKTGDTKDKTDAETNTSVHEVTEEPPANNSNSSSQSKISSITFLNKERAVSSTMLKMTAADLAKARTKAIELAAAAGATLTSDVATQQDGTPDLILRFTADEAKAGPLIEKLAVLGNVKAREASTQELTGRFNKAYEEYRQLQADLQKANDQERPEIEERIDCLEAQLQNWDKEAGKHIIILWLTV